VFTAIAQSSLNPFSLWSLTRAYCEAPLSERSPSGGLPEVSCYPLKSTRLCELFVEPQFQPVLFSPLLYPLVGPFLSIFVAAF